MRILQVPFAYFPYLGGAETLFREISEQLVREGHQVQVLTSAVSAWHWHNFDLPIKPAPSHEVIEGVEVTRVGFSEEAYRAAGETPALRRSFANNAVAEFCRQLRAKVEQMQPDVVMSGLHYHTIVQCACHMKDKLGYPLVLVPGLHEYVPSDDLTQHLKKADAIVAFTEHEALNLASVYHVDRACIFTSALGTKLPTASPAPKARHPRQVLFIGRRSPTKGVNLLVEAMQTVLRQREDVELVVAGTANRESGPPVDAALVALRHRYPDRVKVMGTLEHEQKSNLLATATCVVLPSSEESFGLVILEAWAHQTAVVACDIPSVRSWTRPGENCLLSPTGDATRMAECILRLLDDEQLCQAMAAAGRLEVESRFNWPSVAKKFTAAYEYAIQHHDSMRGEQEAKARRANSPAIVQTDLLVVQACDFLDNGDGMYRFHAPSRALSRLPAVTVVDIELHHRFFPELAEAADVLILAGGFADLFPLLERRRQAGNITVMEANDYYYDIQPWNPLSERWLDRGLQDLFGHLMTHADGIQTSMPELVRRWSKRTDRPLAAFRNQLVDIPPLPPMRTDGPFTIGWGGSPGHFADWYYVAPLLQAWLDSHPDVHLAVMNNDFAKPFVRLAPQRYHFKPFGSLASYLEFVRGLDVGLAPLLPTEYNRCRSEVKFLEYASQGVPGIYADLEPYHGVVTEATGLSYRTPQEFVAALDRLYQDAGLRRQIREAAYKYVSVERRLENHIQERLDFYHRLLPQKQRGYKIRDEVMACAKADGRYLMVVSQDAEKAYNSVQGKNAKETVDILRKLVQKHPRYLMALQVLGQRLNDLKESDQAMTYLEQARALQPWSARVLSEMGRAHFLKQDYSRARALLEQALTINPLYQLGWQYMLRLLTITKDPQGAEWAERCHRHNPQSFAMALLGLPLFPQAKRVATLQRLLDQYAPTLMSEEKAAAAAAFSETIGKHCGAFLVTQEGLALLTRACEVFPLSAQLAHLYGSVLRLAGRHEAALIQHQRALELRRAAQTYKAEFPREDGTLHYWQFADHIRTVTATP